VDRSSPRSTTPVGSTVVRMISGDSPLLPYCCLGCLPRVLVLLKIALVKYGFLVHQATMTTCRAGHGDESSVHCHSSNVHVQQAAAEFTALITPLIYLVYAPWRWTYHVWWGWYPLDGEFASTSPFWAKSDGTDGICNYVRIPWLSFSSLSLHTVA